MCFTLTQRCVLPVSFPVDLLPGAPRLARPPRPGPCLDFGFQYARIRNNRSKKIWGRILGLACLKFAVASLLSITWPLFFRCSAFIVFTLYCLLLLVTWIFAIHTSFNRIFSRQNLQILFLDRITEFKTSAIFFVKINESPMVFQIWFHSLVFFEKHTRETCLGRNSAISFDESCN